MTGEVSRQISPVTGPIFTLAQLALSLRGHMLFTDRSVLTMLHGIVLGGGALLIMAAALYALTTLPAGRGSPIDDRQARLLSRLLTLNAVLLWLTVLGGTYLVFPSYRATPPEGVADLTAYPRAMLLASTDTAWLHAFAMETKEHVPWIAAMLATAVAFVGIRDKNTLLADGPVRPMIRAVLVVCFSLVAYVSILGVFVNKVAPLF